MPLAAFRFFFRFFVATRTESTRIVHVEVFYLISDFRTFWTCFDFDTRHWLVHWWHRMNNIFGSVKKSRFSMKINKSIDFVSMENPIGISFMSWRKQKKKMKEKKFHELERTTLTCVLSAIVCDNIKKKKRKKNATNYMMTNSFAYLSFNFEITLLNVCIFSYWHSLHCIILIKQ